MSDTYHASGMDSLARPSSPRPQDDPVMIHYTVRSGLEGDGNRYTLCGNILPPKTTEVFNQHSLTSLSHVICPMCDLTLEIIKADCGKHWSNDRIVANAWCRAIHSNKEARNA